MDAKKVSAPIDTQKDEDHVVLPGFRFHPTDQELVEFYLRRKVEKKPIKTDLIKHVDVYKYEPWDLPKVTNGDGDKEWYFYCKRGRKYKNSIRPNRVTGHGFWKATGIDKPIQSVGESHDCIGLKKTLVYYRGSAGKGTKTDWMMHEFRLPTKTSTIDTTDQEAEVWTLCRIFKRESSFKKFNPHWRQFSSKQSFSDTRPKTSYSELEIQNDYPTIELSGDRGTERKHVQLSLTNQVPLMASFLGFSCPSGQENVAGGNWDELRPMVEFALDHSEVYRLR